MPLASMSCPTNSIVSNPMINCYAFSVTLHLPHRWNTVRVYFKNVSSFSPKISMSSMYTSHMLYMRLLSTCTSMLLFGEITEDRRPIGYRNHSKIPRMRNVLVGSYHTFDHLHVGHFPSIIDITLLLLQKSTVIDRAVMGWSSPYVELYTPGRDDRVIFLPERYWRGEQN